MDLKELPTELAHFVQQALASGTYPSADELVADAVRLLRDQGAMRKARQHTPDASAPMDVSAHTPDDLVRMTRQALEAGEAGHARHLAIAGSQRYPDHAELRKYARVLAPPTARVVPASPASRASVKANGAWLKAHRTAYLGRWIALRAGTVVRVADSFEALVADMGDTTGLLLTKVV